MYKSALLVALLSAFVGHAHADVITNGSFENTQGTFVGDVNHVDELSSGSTVIPGWTTLNGTDTAWIQNGNPYAIPAADGNFFLDLTGYTDTGKFGGVSQTFATTAGTTYLVTFDLGYGGSYSVLRGPTSLTASAGTFSNTFTSGSGAPNPAVWDLESFQFTATSSSSTLSFIGASTAGEDYIGLDNVHVDPLSASTVPEPSSLALVLSGVGVVGRLVRRARRTHVA